MTYDQAIEATAKALCDASPFDDDKPSDYYAEARAVAPILMEAGAKMALDAAAHKAEDTFVGDTLIPTMRIAAAIRQLDPAEVVKDASK